MDPLVVKERRALWLSRIQDLSRSGMTQKAWCQREEIPFTTLRYWIRKLRLSPEEMTTPTTDNWLELTQTGEMFCSSAAAEIPASLPTLVFRTDRYALEFYERISPPQLSEYLKEPMYP